MTKQPRRAAKRNGTTPGPVDRAIDAVAAKTGPIPKTVLLDRKPIQLDAGKSITLHAPSNPNQAPLMIRGDDGLWHGILMPPGSTWELKPKLAGGLWTPPGTKA